MLPAGREWIGRFAVIASSGIGAGLCALQLSVRSAQCSALRGFGGLGISGGWRGWVSLGRKESCRLRFAHKRCWVNQRWRRVCRPCGVRWRLFWVLSCSPKDTTCSGVSISSHRSKDSDADWLGCEAVAARHSCRSTYLTSTSTLYIRGCL